MLLLIFILLIIYVTAMGVIWGTLENIRTSLRLFFSDHRLSTMPRDGGMEIQLRTFLTSALDGVSSQLHIPTTLPLRKETPSNHWLGKWVAPRVTLNSVEKKDLCYS